MRVTVIPSDKTIGVDGRFLEFDFTAAPGTAGPGIHAIQWHGGHGEMEFADKAEPNRILTAADYEAIVMPYALAWQAEAARLDSPPPPPAPEEIKAARIAEIRAELDNIDRRSVRPMRAIIRAPGTDEDRSVLAGLQARAEALREELAGLEEAE